MFLDNYEKMKNGESNPKIDKEDKDNNYYNFGFEE